MSYSTPPALASDTTVLVVGNTTATLVAAPGPGLAIRVVGWYGYVNRLATGVVDISLVGVARFGGLSVAGKPGSEHNFPEPGVQLAVNTALQVTYGSSVAVGSGYSGAFYYIDSVS